MPNKRLPILFFFIVAALTSGCARVTTLSVIHADGSFNRTVTYRVNEPQETKSANGSGAASGGSMGTQRFEDLATLPHGQEWKVRRSKESSTSVISATREVAPGTPLANDLGLKTGSSQPGTPAKATSIIANQVTVTKTPDARLVYREVLHWTGKADEQLSKPIPEVVKAIGEVLPASVRSDSKAIGSVAVVTQLALWTALFGAPRPLFSEFTMNQDYAAYQLGRRMKPEIARALNEQFGSRLTASEKATIADKLVASVSDSASEKTKPDAAQSNTEPNLVAMLYRAQFPGKVLSTNGELDDSSNEVVWSLYSLGPSAKDVVLTATCQTP